MNRRLPIVLTVGLLILGTAASADQLFLDSRPVDPDLFSQATVEARRVTPNLAALANGAETLELELFDGTAVTARLSGLEARGPGDVTWRGHLGDGYRVILTLKNGFVVGLVYSPQGVYEVSTLPDGTQGFARVEQDLYEPCAVDGHAGTASTPKGPAPVGDYEVGALTDVTLLGVYTDEARIGAGGVAQIEATIQAAIDNANTGFIDSLADTRFTLVHTAEIGWVENGNGSAALSWVINDEETRALRNEYQADMVGMTIENWGAFCGVAQVMRNPSHNFAPLAFQVTRRSCAVGNLTYAHEHGHNLGFEHDPANGAPPQNASWPFAFGHFVDGSYRTIMSYSNQCTQGCTRVAHWSNPDVTHNGEPTGIEDERENWLAGNLNDDFSTDFRGKAVGVSVSGSCPGAITVEMTNAAPSSEVFAVLASPGSFQLKSTACIGSVLPAGEPFKGVLPAVSDASGNATWNINVGPAACGKPMFVYDFPSCSASATANLPSD